MEYRGAIDALIDSFVDVIVGETCNAVTLQEESHERGATLRNQEAVRALLGPRLDDALTAIVDETTRRAAQRYASTRRHPRYSSDPLINDIDDADATLGKEIIAAQGKSCSTPSLGLAIALIRSQAASMAAGATPIAGPAAARKTTSQPIPRRRSLTAADIPGQLAQAIFAAARGDEVATVRAEFERLELTDVNRGAIVTKVKVALERDPKTARRLADDLRDAGVAEIAPPIDGPRHEIGSRYPTPAPAPRAAVMAPARSPPDRGANRPSIKARIRAKQSGTLSRTDVDE